MPKIISSNYNQDQLSFDILVSASEYENWSSKIERQILKTVKVDGFMKGKVPLEVARKNVDSDKLLETIEREVIQRATPEILEEASKTVKEKAPDRAILDVQAKVMKGAHMQDDGTFKYQLVYAFLPKIDLTPILEVKNIKLKKSDLPERVTFKEFLEKQEAALSNAYKEAKQQQAESEDNSPKSSEKDTDKGSDKPAKTTSKVKTSKDKYADLTLAQVLAEDPETFKGIDSYEDFKKSCEDIYNKETVALEKAANFRLVKKLLLEKIEFKKIDKKILENHIEKIVKDVQEVAKANKSNLSGVAYRFGLNPLAKKINDEKSLRELVSEKVFTENNFLELAFTLHPHLLVDGEYSFRSNLQSFIEQAKKDPRKYGLAADPKTDPKTFELLAARQLASAMLLQLIADYKEGKEKAVEIIKKATA